MKQEIRIQNKIIGENNPCFIIAEAGVNHNGDINLAKKLIDSAVDAKVDAIKFQTFKAENLVTKKAKMAEYQEQNTGIVESQFDMLKRLELKEEDYKELKEYCDSKNILFLSTPHTVEAVDVLDSIVPAYKLGSGDLINTLLLKRIAQTKKPVILGTGMSTMDDVKFSERYLRKNGCNNTIYLHCTTNYPCPFDEVNLNAMITMDEEIESMTGYSDHTMGILVPVMARIMGAKVIEKHFTLDKNMEGPDHKASLEPHELKQMVEEIRLIETILGSKNKKPNMSEEKVAKIARKSLMPKIKIKKGEQITFNNIVCKRPADGISPKLIDEVIGKTAKRDLEEDELMTLEDLE